MVHGILCKIISKFGNNMTITVNGSTISTNGNDVVVNNSGIYVDGKLIETGKQVI